MMIGNGQWATTRDKESVDLFLADISMRKGLEQQWRQRRREFWRSVWARPRRSHPRTP